MKNLMRLTVVLGCWAGHATSFDEVEVRCPLDGTRLLAKQLTSSNTLGGQDRDFLRLAAGDQPFMLAATTCPTCLYSGRTDEFQATPDGGTPEVSAAVRHAVLERHALSIPDGGALDEPWVRLALAAQVAELRGASPEQVGWARLEVSWAVRVGEKSLPLTGLEDPALVAIRKRTGNRALAELECATWLVDSKRGPLTRERGTLAAALLRRHGEHEALLALLPKLRPVMDAKTWPAQEAALRSSIERERGFQRAARQAFEQALTGRAPLSDSEAASVLTYLVGELSRRLGEDAKARTWLERSRTVAGAPSFLASYAAEQLARLPRR